MTKLNNDKDNSDELVDYVEVYYWETRPPLYIPFDIKEGD
nr:hypothetical protein [uncultured Mediterranean phage uvMED]